MVDHTDSTPPDGDQGQKRPLIDLLAQIATVIATIIATIVYWPELSDFAGKVSCVLREVASIFPL